MLSGPAAPARRSSARPLLAAGEMPDDPELAFAGWQSALRLPNVMGIVAGWSLLYPRTATWPAAGDGVA